MTRKLLKAAMKQISTNSMEIRPSDEPFSLSSDCDSEICILDIKQGEKVKNQLMGSEETNERDYRFIGAEELIKVRCRLTSVWPDGGGDM